MNVQTLPESPEKSVNLAARKDEASLAAALRANLAKRKAQQRARTADSTESPDT